MGRQNLDIVFQNIVKDVENVTAFFFLRMSIIAKQVLEKAVRDTGAVATGDLASSIEAHIVKRHNDFVLSLTYGAGYASFANEGTRKHFPPVSAIMKWLLFKQRSLSYRTLSELRRHAFLVARSISVKGTKQRKFYELGVRRLIPILEAELKRM